LKYDTQSFYNRNMQLISIRLNKHNIHYVKQWFQGHEAHLLIKRIFMSWETPYNFVVYNQIMIRNVKSLQ
jgi:hypothetical protein